MIPEVVVMDHGLDVFNVWLHVFNKDFMLYIEREKTEGHRVTVVERATTLIYDEMWKPEDIDEIMKDPVTWLKLMRL